MKTRKANPVENPEELKPGQHVFLRVGDQVSTPYGVGKVESIALQLGVYEVDDKGKTKTELDPPRIEVTITETGQTVVVCLCELGLPLASYEKVVKEEFDRLWPPVEQPAPEADENSFTVAELKNLRRSQVARVRAMVGSGSIPRSAAEQRLAALRKVRTREDWKRYHAGVRRMNLYYRDR